MIILSDTSIWIEFLKAHDPIFSSMRPLLERGSIVGLSCVFGELLQGARNHHERQIILNYWNQIPKCDETNIFIQSGCMSSELHLPSRGVGLIDAAIITYARENHLKIWSLDKKLLALLKSTEIFQSV